MRKSCPSPKKATVYTQVSAPFSWISQALGPINGGLLSQITGLTGLNDQLCLIKVPQNGGFRGR